MNNLLDVKTIDKYNIREATFIATKNALGNLDQKPVKALIDGESIKNISVKLFSEIGIKAITSIKDKVCSASNENNEPSRDLGSFLNFNKLHILIEKFGLQTLLITSSDKFL
mgnify:CR=1 FL=1